VSALVVFALGVLVGIVLALVGVLLYGFWIAREYPR
jgi:hypothetical protein